jgi:hypothetical protein
VPPPLPNGAGLLIICSLLTTQINERSYQRLEHCDGKRLYWDGERETGRDCGVNARPSRGDGLMQGRELVRDTSTKIHLLNSVPSVGQTSGARGKFIEARIWNSLAGKFQGVNFIQPGSGARGV